MAANAKAKEENPVYADDATNFDASLRFDTGDGAQVVMTQYRDIIEVPVDKAIDFAVALLAQAAPWKLR